MACRGARGIPVLEALDLRDLRRCCELYKRLDRRASVVAATLGVPMVSAPRGGRPDQVRVGGVARGLAVRPGLRGNRRGLERLDAGALILALADAPSLAFDLSGWMHAQKLCHQARKVSPQKLPR
jgi:hypothetical protein